MGRDESEAPSRVGRVWRHPAEDRFVRRHRSPWARSVVPSRRNVLAAAPSTPKAGSTHGPANGLWIKQIGDRIVGMLRLTVAGPGAARIVAFRVDPEWYHTAVVKDLIEAVHSHCRRHGCSRVLVDFDVAPPWMPSVLSRQGFRVLWHDRTWEAILAT
jgi:hypothetical protein